MKDVVEGAAGFVTPKESGSIAALLTDNEQLGPSDQTQTDAFVARWNSDVRPVHERTERSRVFRTVYIVLGVCAALIVNAVAFSGTIVLAVEYGPEIGGELVAPQKMFLLGIAIALLELTLWFIVLDTDVMRQKRERLAARLSLAMQFGRDCADLATFKSKVRGVESFYWSVGVGLTWTNVALQLVSFGLFLGGCGQIVSALAR